MNNLNDRKIYLDDPNVGDLELKYIQQAIQNNEIVTGSFIQKFEEKMADWLGIEKENCVACSSGTAALHMALKVLNIGPRDEIILPTTTFVATANVIKYVDATPVFVDIDPWSWNINPIEIEKAITPKTKAIIVVHLYGNPCNMSKIISLAKEYNLYIIEDACESLTSNYQYQQTGTFGDIGCFSFNGNKIITGAGGGMIIAENKEYANKSRYIINQAKPNFEEVGYNYRMSNIQAGMLLGQWDKLENFSYIKRRINKIYYNYFKNKIQMQHECVDGWSNCWMNAIKINTKKRIKLVQEELNKKNIPTRRIFKPITSLKPYYDYFEYTITKNFLHSYDLYCNGLCLPSSTKNTYEDIEYVAETLLEVIK